MRPLLWLRSRNRASEAGRRRAGRAGAPEIVLLADMDALLDWFGVKDLAEWNALDFEEKRSYHRKDGKIVDRRDDILKATFYAVMMKRYAVAPDSFGVRQSHAPQQSIASVRL